MSDDWKGIGISWLWGLPETHPFTSVALEHDKAYERGSTIKDDIKAFKGFVAAGMKASSVAERVKLVGVEAPVFLGLMLTWRAGSRLFGRKI